MDGFEPNAAIALTVCFDPVAEGGARRRRGPEREVILRVHGATEWLSNIQAGLQGEVPPLLAAKRGLDVNTARPRVPVAKRKPHAGERSHVSPVAKRPQLDGGAPLVSNAL